MKCDNYHFNSKWEKIPFVEYIKIKGLKFRLIWNKYETFIIRVNGKSEKRYKDLRFLPEKYREIFVAMSAEEKRYMKKMKMLKSKLK